MQYNPVVLKETLQKYWNHASFRPLQEAIITDVMHQKDVLAILPTGGGKSICYQLPALLLEGTCIVISPLIALMNDQIASLKNKGIEALTIPSNSSQDDIIRLFDNIRVKEIKMIYLSPERFSQPLIQEKLKQLTRSFIAIDEAHCISQWGHDFRPSYLKIGNLKTLFPNTPILAVTATATTKTQEQIVALLQLKNVQKHIGSFYRENLAYQIYKTPQKFDLLTKILSKRKIVTIIYLQNRLAVMELAKRLEKLGHQATYYHAGLTVKEKEKNYSDWLSEHKNIMIATSAFGMGIDKSNVRLVIHLEIPNNLESYLQEAGRAGRDEQKSFSCVILAQNDYLKYSNQILHNQLTFEFVSNIYQKINQHFQIAFGELIQEKFDFDIENFCSKHQLNVQNTSKALQRLDNYGILTYQDTFQTHTYIKILGSNRQLLDFCNTQKKYRILIESILRNYSGIFEIQKKINIARLSEKTEISIKKIHKKLAYLKSIQLIDYEKKENNHSITFLVPREDKITLNKIKRDLVMLNQIDIQKKELTLAYFKNEMVCRNQLILNYFQESTQKECGICDICLEKTKEHSWDELCKIVLIKLKNKPLTFNELMVALKSNTNTTQKVLNYLLDEDNIYQNLQFYQLKNE
ncbi:RecQ family ATP-dependent DNA helicase [Wenyingzhuangia sp. 1_MG-2023]|nr:RecQ family ATP-dependent DNA helicase [Wenyingzhuangia sp. 1_MG-2023]